MIQREQNSALKDLQQMTLSYRDCGPLAMVACRQTNHQRVISDKYCGHIGCNNEQPHAIAVMREYSPRQFCNFF